MDHKIVHILWTGGLDSTYRMVELSRKKCVIQPHYVIVNRKNIKNELKAISAITRILNSDKRTIAEIRPVETFSKHDLEVYPDIQSAWEMLHEKKDFKSQQYPLFTRYARQKGLKLEMGIQFSKNGTVSKVIDESYCLKGFTMYFVAFIESALEGNRYYYFEIPAFRRKHEDF